MKGEGSLPWTRCRLTSAVLTVALLSVGSRVPPVLGAEAKSAGSFEIPAWTFDRGNAKVFANPDIYAGYRDKLLLSVAYTSLACAQRSDFEFTVSGALASKLERKKGSGLFFGQ